MVRIHSSRRMNQCRHPSCHFSQLHVKLCEFFCLFFMNVVRRPFVDGVIPVGFRGLVVRALGKRPFGNLTDYNCTCTPSPKVS
jgi:hypothetical protein